MKFYCIAGSACAVASSLPAKYASSACASISRSQIRVSTSCKRAVLSDRSSSLTSRRLTADHLDLRGDLAGEQSARWLSRRACSATVKRRNESRAASSAPVVEGAADQRALGFVALARVRRPRCASMARSSAYKRLELRFFDARLRVAPVQDPVEREGEFLHARDFTQRREYAESCDASPALRVCHGSRSARMLRLLPQEFEQLRTQPDRGIEPRIRSGGVRAQVDQILDC